MDNAGDVVIEYAGEGYDTVLSSVSYQLGADVERLELTGSAAINGTGNSQDNTLIGNDGDNVLDGGLGADTLSGGRGADILLGGAGSDTYLFGLGDGQDVVFESPDGYELDVVQLAAGIVPQQVSLVRAGTDLHIRLASGDQLTIVGQYEGRGIEQIRFTDGPTWGAYEIHHATWEITGTDGDDFLMGHAGDDVFHGGAGNDLLVAGEGGSDTYLFGLGDGQDVVFESPDGYELDVVQLAAGIVPQQVSLVRAGTDLHIRLASGDQLTIIGQYEGRGIEQIRFTDGPTWGAYEIHHPTWEITGTDGDDFLMGHAGDDVFHGGAGNDLLVAGEGGSDTYLFGLGDGQDVVFESPDGYELDVVQLAAGIVPQQVSLVRAGTDLHIRLASGDQLTIVGQYEGRGIEQIRFTDGPTWGAYEIHHATWEITGTDGDDFLMGHAGDDVFHGGAGNDLLVAGEGGSDTYLFGLGDGQDVVFESPDGYELDVVQLAAGIVPQQVSLVRAGTDLHIRLASGDQLTIVGQYEGRGIEQIRFADGPTWGAYEIHHASWELIGTPDADHLLGSYGADVLQGMGGDDMLIGGSGSDIYVFNLGDGRDTVLEEFDGNGDIDVVKLGAGIAPHQVRLVRSGSDLILRLSSGEQLTVAGQYDGRGIEAIQFTDGPTWGAYEIQNADRELIGTDGNDILKGCDGADMLVGLGGDDVLEGGMGSDTYIFNIGDGRDVVLEAYGFYNDYQDFDVVKLGSGIDPRQVSLLRSGNDLQIRLSTGDQLTIVGQYEGRGIEVIQFANGLTWGPYEIHNAGSEVIGTPGTDWLWGRDGADVFQGMGGDDMLFGESGSDTYVFNIGDGRDVVREVLDGNGDVDVVKLGAGILAKDVSLVRSGADLVLRLATGDQITIVNQYQMQGIEEIHFADGTKWGAYEIDRAAYEFVGTEMGDTLGGTPWNDILKGLGGNDYLWGGDGNDVLIGGFGADMLQGGNGNDTFVFDNRFGTDSIHDFSSRSGKLYIPEEFQTNLDKIAISQSGLRIGDGDTLVENAAYAYGPDGLRYDAELVIFQNKISGPIGIGAMEDMIKYASVPYRPGDQRLFVASNGTDTGVFLFTESNYDFRVTGSELTLLGTLKGTPSTVLDDYIFIA